MDTLFIYIHSTLNKGHIDQRLANYRAKMKLALCFQQESCWGKPGLSISLLITGAMLL